MELVGKVMSLLVNMLSRLAIAFLPRSKSPLISWLKSLSAMILEPPKIKSLIFSIVSPFICHNIQKTKIMASGPITSWQIDGEIVEIVTNFIFLGSKITDNGDCKP